MRLLIITQSIDKNNPVLGFFHRWVEEFAKNFEKITVICLEKGEYNLPNNVKVMSLGKESKKSRMRYVMNFYKYIWNERKNYDAVFVHMNQEYVLMGSILWKIISKKIVLWRNHYAGSIFTYIACILCNKIFCTSKFSYTAKFKKTVLMPVGIDTNIFKSDPLIKRVPHSILFLGRIAPSKNVHVFIEALVELNKKGIDFTSSIYGDAGAGDELYYDSLKAKAKEFGIGSKVSFYRGVPNQETPKIYNAHDIFVNLSPSGMYDKTIFEAMLCGCLVLASNKNLNEVVDRRFIFKENDVVELSTKLASFLKADENERCGSQIELEGYARGSHSLSLLALMLFKEIK